MSFDPSPIVIDAVNKALSKAESFYGCTFPVGNILFNMRGRAAGQVRFPLNKQNNALPEIRFNLQLLNENFDAFISEVVPHECAHLVVFRLYALKMLKTRVRPKPHGLEWQFVMQNIYGLEPKVTHSFDVKQTQTQKFEYICGCDDKIHRLSIIRHNKVQRRVTNYLCKACGKTLKFI